MSSSRYTLLLIALCAAPLAGADPIYKCVQPDGSIAFQDHPCPANASQSEVHVAPPPPADADAAPAIPPPPEATPEKKPQEPPAKPPPKPLPSMWVCRSAQDGKTYFSRNGKPRVYYVPLGMMGYPGRSLAQAYGPGGIGVSAPGMRQIPIDHSPANAMASEYTPMQDTCVRASRNQTCGYLRKQYDKAQQDLDNAKFDDQRAKLQPRVDKLSGELDGC